MALDNYDALQASVANWLNRADLAAAVPDFIALAEAQISRRLLKDGPVRRMMARTTLTVAAEFVAVPSDFMGVRTLYNPGSTTYRTISFAEPEKMDELKTTYPNQTGDPYVFSVVGCNLQFYPWVGGNYSMALTYWQRIPALSADNPTNWFLSVNPDAYLYGALTQSAPFLKDDARLTTWGTLYTAALADTVAADKIERTAPNISIPIVPGGTF